MTSKSVETYPLELALEYAAGIIRTHGYTSKKENAQSGKHSTSHTLGVWLTNPATPNTLPEDAAKAKEAESWLLTRRSSANSNRHHSYQESDFNISIRNLVNGGYRGVAPGMITKSDFGFVACVYATMERASNSEAKRAEATESASSSEYMGSVKKRAEFFVKLIGKKYNDNVGCYIYNVKDRKGNLGIFFSGDSSLADINECFLAKMTPKRHSVNVYHGGKETVFNRIKIIENVGAPPTS